MDVLDIKFIKVKGEIKELNDQIVDTVYQLKGVDYEEGTGKGANDIIKMAQAIIEVAEGMKKMKR